MGKFSTLGILALAGCCFFGADDEISYTAVSPDGKNEIRLWANPLAYEVRRGGAVVVAKSEIGMKVDGKCLNSRGEDAPAPTVERRSTSGTVETPVYKKARVDLSGNETFVGFGDWGVRLAARNDGVAYRFETRMPGRIRVNCEKADVAFKDEDVKCTVNFEGAYGAEESVPVSTTVGKVVTDANDKTGGWQGRKMAYMPFVFEQNGKFCAVTESDVHDYPIWNLVRGAGDGARVRGRFAGWPKKTERIGGWGDVHVNEGGRWVRVLEHEDYLCETKGTRTFPWRTFVLGDEPVRFCEADIVYALATPRAPNADFSWVKPGKVAWDWWNAFDNLGEEKGCTTKGYERFIDFAAKTGVEYVIFDEGWSESLNIWKFHPRVDVKHLIDYANKKGVGIILWMAWAQVYGCEEKVASHFAKLGAKGFKVDFMDRADAEIANFLEKFAAACQKEKMLVDYHGVCHPVGLSRTYPNIINYEGVHGLEQMKFYHGLDMMANDVNAFFLRMTAGPLDYTPGAMNNYALGKYPVGEEAKKVNTYVNPGSLGTRCRQMAMMALYEAPLQMLCDSPTNYEKNMECFSFMAGTPTVWSATVGLGGALDKFAAVARKAKDGSWYAAAITGNEARDFTLDTSFLGGGTWSAEIFRDAADSATAATHYVHEKNVTVKSGETKTFHMAPGGGFIVKFTK